MYTLYWSARTGAFVVHAMLEELGVEYKLVTVDTQKGEHQTAEFLAINPRGQIPALKLPDGSVLAESAAIVLHLGDCHPETGLLPPPGDSARGQLYRWLFFATNNIYEADLRYYYSDRYTTDANGVEQVKTAAVSALDRWWDLVEAELKPDSYMLGEQFSALDIYMVMLIIWHPDTDGLFERCPKLQSLWQRVQQRPAIARIWRQNND